MRISAHQRGGPEIRPHCPNCDYRNAPSPCKGFLIACEQCPKPTESFPWAFIFATGVSFASHGTRLGRGGSWPLPIRCTDAPAPGAAGCLGSPAPRTAAPAGTAPGCSAGSAQYQSPDVTTVSSGETCERVFAWPRGKYRVWKCSMFNFQCPIKARYSYASRAAY